MSDNNSIYADFPRQEKENRIIGARMNVTLYNRYLSLK
jgi:hypothetical protein